MTKDSELLERVREALRADTRVGFDEASISLSVDGDQIIIDGEVADIAAKRWALHRAAELVQNRGIVDRLHVRPAVAMEDGMIRDLVRNALIDEAALSRCRLRERVKGKFLLVRDPPGARETIDIRVEDGVVILEGEVAGLAEKRLAGALAWWVAGSRDVINRLRVVPAEADNDFEIVDAVRLVLEKDPFVNADQLRVRVKQAVVNLDGLVPTESERDMAEHDAWYVFGVEDVVNRIEVKA
ncbi:MAG TPA: BON domain-containing protein [Stellaceae bacterium]|nr:BON domain-containing protein [Stellaceae bacterium]